MAHTTDIVGYTFNADQYCPDCIRGMFIDEYSTMAPYAVARKFASTEDVLYNVAGQRKLNRDNESSFDSGDFPKVIFRDQTHDLYASGCGQDEHGCNSRCGQCGAILGGYDMCPALDSE